MKEKLLELLRNEGLKSGQFAEMLGISQSVVSHFLGGRNKPSFEVLQKILKRFPRINPDWLLLDSPQMYRDDSEGFAARQQQNADGGKPIPQAAPAASANLFSSVPGTPASESAKRPQPLVPESSAPTTPQRTPTAIRPKRAERIVIFYEDGSFESYAPTAE